MGGDGKLHLIRQNWLKHLITFKILIENQQDILSIFPHLALKTSMFHKFYARFLNILIHG